MFIVNEDYKLGPVEERLSLGGMMISPLMVLRFGITRAFDLCLTGRIITATRAVEYGLVNRVVLREKLDQERELANALALYARRRENWFDTFYGIMMKLS
jgi:enoyl-CoA hydratase/carnithine racemase